MTYLMLRVSMLAVLVAFVANAFSLQSPRNVRQHVSTESVTRLCQELKSKSDEDLAEERAAVQEVGGDASFLDHDDDEAERRTEELAEILELGGDPSFLEGFSQSQREPSLLPLFDNLDAEELEACGGDPSFLPGYEMDKGKDTFKQDGEAPDTSFLQNLVGAREAAQKEDDFDIPSMEDLEAMGGDPSFLQPGGTVPMTDDLKVMGGDATFLEQSPSQPTSVKRDVPPPGFPVSEGPCYTAMDGESYDSTMDEIEALGGDPFFLDPSEVEERMPEEKLSDVSPELVSSAGPSFLLQKYARQPLEPEGPPHADKRDLSAEEEEILELGGDPSFLASYDEHDASKAYQYELDRAEILDMGGDPSFL